jgi:hypothetical protein
MAHYAFLDNNNIVTQVIVGIDETELIEGKDPESWYGHLKGQTCKRTSYNGNYRKNYAGIGFTYDLELDAFIPPKPFTQWVLDEETCLWAAPIPYPNDGLAYVWNDNKADWELANFSSNNEQLEA